MSDSSNTDENVSQAYAGRDIETVQLTHAAQRIEDEKVVANKQQIECIKRIKNLPVILNSLQFAMKVYERIKSFGSVTHCLCDISEKTVRSALELVDSINSQIPIDCPFQTIDLLICNGLDCIESIIPGIKLPPDEIYNNLKKCVFNVCICIQKFIYGFKKYTQDTFNKYLFISTCLIGIIQDWIQEFITTSYSEEQHQLTHAEYEMIIEAIRSCADCQKEMGYHTSPSESTDISSPISDLSVEF